jgi:hypothetical protein
MHWFLGVLALSACAVAGTNAPQNLPQTKVVDVGGDFELSPSQTAVLDGGALAITFVKVSEDSRCPEGVQCVWQGDVATALLLGATAGEKTPVTLHTTLTPHSATSGSYSVALTGIKPVRKKDSAIPQADYIATFRVTRQ